MEIPFSGFAELFGYTLKSGQLAILNTVQWFLFAVIAFGGYDFFKKWLTYKSRTDFSRIVMGAGTFIEDKVLHLRNFMSGELSYFVIDHFLQRAVVRAAHQTKVGNEILLIEDEVNREAIRADITNGLAEFSRPEKVGRISGGKNGPINFITALASEDHALYKKIRVIIITEDDLRLHLDPNFWKSLKYDYGKDHHVERAKLLHQLAKIWFSSDTTRRDKLAWITELTG